MKDIKSFITEGENGWEFIESSWDNSGEPLDALDISAVKWILVNTESEFIMAVTEKDLKSWSEDEGDDTLEKEVKKLKIGESYNADGGINIYLRIK